MFRRILFAPFACAVLFAAAAVSVSAQATIGGKVEMKKSETETVPVEGAKVDCYRVDIVQSCRSTTTNSRGEFLLLGVPYTGQVVLAVSGEGLAPRLSPIIKGGSEGVVIETVAGDGNVPTEEQVRAAVAGMATTGELTEEQKKAQAEYEKKVKEITAKNEEAKNKNALYDKYSSEGDAAYKQQDFALAAEKYEEGYKVDPEYMGSAPVFLNKRADALLNKAIIAYNTAIKTGDKATIDKAKAEVARDMSDALTTVNKAYGMTTNAKPAEIISPDAHKKNIKASVDVAKSIVSTMVKMNVSLASYIADENDAENAVKIYKDTLVMLPGDPDVMAGLALSLYLSGEFLGNKEKKQESLNYWTEYTKVAPKDHSQQAAAAEFIDILTNIDKLKAQSVNK